MLQWKVSAKQKLLLLLLLLSVLFPLASASIIVKQGIIYRTTSNNTKFTMGADLTFYRTIINSSHLWLDQTYSTKHYTRYCIYVSTPNDVTFTINNWFQTKDGINQSEAELILTSGTNVNFALYCPNLVSIVSVSGVTSWSQSGNTVLIIASAITTIGIKLVVNETAYNHAPENMSVEITNMDSENYVFVGTKYYVFRAKFWDGDGYSDLDSMKVAFYDGLHWINASYSEGFDLENGTDEATGEAVVSLKGETTVIDSNVLQVDFEFQFKTHILDANNVDIYLYCIDNSGINDGWDLMATDYFNIYNLGGHSILTTSGTYETVSINYTVNADSYVASSSPNNNFGTDTILQVENLFVMGESIYIKSWLKFSVNYANALSAKLFLYTQQAPTGNPTVDIYSCADDSWTETGITWNNQPVYADKLDSEVVINNGAWYSWTVTNFVRQESNSDQIASFCLDTLTEADCSAWFYSKEHGSFEPYLEIQTPHYLSGRLPGGDVFDLYAYNNSWAQSEIIFNNIQHIKLLPSLVVERQSDQWNIVNVQYFVDYYMEDGWIDGFTLNLTFDQRWSGTYRFWNATAEWYRGTELLKTNIVNMYWAANQTEYYGADLLLQYWVDLWFNRENASSTFGARINAYYYPMKDDSSPWLRWLTGSNWGIDEDKPKQTMAFERMVKPDNSTLYAREMEMVKIGVRLTVGSSSSAQYVRFDCHDIFDLTLGVYPIQGIQTPVFDETKVPVMPQGGFLGAIFSFFGSLWQTLNNVFGPALLGFWNVFVGFLDTVFTAFGWRNGFSEILNLISQFLGWVPTAISLLVDILIQIFVFITGTFSLLVSYFVSWISALSTFYDNLVWIWNYVFPYWGWIPGVLYQVFPLILFFFTLWIISPILEKRNLQHGFEGTKSRLELTVGLILKGATFLWNVVHFVVYLISRLIESVPIAE